MGGEGKFDNSSPPPKKKKQKSKVNERDFLLPLARVDHVRAFGFPDLRSIRVGAVSYPVS